MYMYIYIYIYVLFICIYIYIYIYSSFQPLRRDVEVAQEGYVHVDPGVATSL